MFTLSLIQGVVNTFVNVLSLMVSALVDRRGGGGYNLSGYGFDLLHLFCEKNYYLYSLKPYHLMV